MNTSSTSTPANAAVQYYLNGGAGIAELYGNLFTNIIALIGALWITKILITDGLRAPTQRQQLFLQFVNLINQILPICIMFTPPEIAFLLNILSNLFGQILVLLVLFINLSVLKKFSILSPKRITPRLLLTLKSIVFITTLNAIITTILAAIPSLYNDTIFTVESISFYAFGGICISIDSSISSFIVYLLVTTSKKTKRTTPWLVITQIACILICDIVSLALFGTGSLGYVESITLPAALLGFHSVLIHILFESLKGIALGEVKKKKKTTALGGSAMKGKSGASSKGLINSSALLNRPEGVVAGVAGSIPETEEMGSRKPLYNPLGKTVKMRSNQSS